MARTIKSAWRQPTRTDYRIEFIRHIDGFTEPEVLHLLPARLKASTTPLPRGISSGRPFTTRAGRKAFEYRQTAESQSRIDSTAIRAFNMTYRRIFYVIAAAASLLALTTAGPAMRQHNDGAARIVGEASALHYAPAENLEHIDVALINQAKTSIDMAAYVLTDFAVIQALTRAAGRGVAIRIYLDGGQFGSRDPKQPFHDLKLTPGVVIKKKQAGEALMHLKAFQIDGRVLRTGSANFSASGLTRQDNDLLVIESVNAVDAFRRNFDRVFQTGQALQ